MFSVLDRFKYLLEDISYPTVFEGWHIKGRIKNKSNQEFKFDVQGMTKVNEDRLERNGNFKSKADKMVFETDINWIVVDLEELHNYLRNTNNKYINLNTIVNEFQWNIILVK